MFWVLAVLSGWLTAVSVSAARNGEAGKLFDVVPPALVAAGAAVWHVVAS